MPEPGKAELLRALGRLVRGLSALFWGLPISLVLYVQVARTDWLEILGPYAVLLPFFATGLILFGLIQMSHFQPQERIWARALGRAQLMVFVIIGLVPFLYWWHRLPFVPLYSFAVGTLTFLGILFLFNLNHLLQRLTAMLPDETLRLETKLFTGLNRWLLMAIPVVAGIYFGLSRARHLPRQLIEMLTRIQPVAEWLTLFLLLMPLAMTMALIWKIKEVIFESVFGDN